MKVLDWIACYRGPNDGAKSDSSSFCIIGKASDVETVASPTGSTPPIKSVANGFSETWKHWSWIGKVRVSASCPSWDGLCHGPQRCGPFVDCQVSPRSLHVTATTLATGDDTVLNTAVIE